MFGARATGTVGGAKPQVSGARRPQLDSAVQA